MDDKKVVAPYSVYKLTPTGGKVFMYDFESIPRAEQYISQLKVSDKENTYFIETPNPDNYIKKGTHWYYRTKDEWRQK